MATTNRLFPRRSFIAAASALVALPVPGWTAVDDSTDCDDMWTEPEPGNGEFCFAISLITIAPNRWQPRTVFDVPTFWQRGAFWWPSVNPEPVVRSVWQFNSRVLDAQRAGQQAKSWSVVLTMIYPVDQSARPIGDALARPIGGVA